MFRVLFLVLISLPLRGQKIMVDNGVPKNITSTVKIWVEPDAGKGIEEIKQEKFIDFHENTYIAAASNKALWIKISIQNKTKTQKDWILECGEKGIEHIDFYIPDQTGKYLITKRGMALKKDYPISQNYTPYAPFSLDPDSSNTIYIKLYGERNLLFQLWLLTPAEHAQKVFNSSIQNSFLWGVLIIRMLYVFLLALVAVKERLFRVYAFHLLFVTLSYFGAYNTLGRFFTNNLQTGLLITILSSHFLGFTYLLFTLTALPLHQFPRIIKWIFIVGMSLNLCVGFLIIVDYNWWWLKISNDIIIFAWTVSSALFAYAFIKKINVNWYYIIPFLLGNSYGSFQLLQVISVEWVAAYATQITNAMKILFMAEFIFFGYFLGRIIRNYERSKLSSEKQLAFEKAQAEKLTELDSLKTRFFANISHEFRTPLTLILSPLKDLQKEFPSRGIFNTMQQNAERLLALINQLLDLSKLEAGKMEVQRQPGDVAQFLEYLFSSFESLAQNKQILFQYEQSHTHFPAAFDVDKVEKIVTNLLSNAFKFTPQNGRVRIRVDYHPTDMVLTVQDFGIGIEAERLPHIFDRFYQADSGSSRNYEGTGIGLALVKELVEVMSGTITAESTPGRGTTFTVVLPVTATKGEAVRVMPSAKPSFSKEVTATPTVSENGIEKGLLLIVEDNSELRSYVRSIFEADYHIVEANDGQEGLEKATEQLPDAVICDLMMPRLDGFGFCQALKSDELTHHIPVVMLTAKATLEDRLEGLELGADDYLAKPFDRDELQIRVRNLVKQRQLLQAKFGRPNPLPTPASPEERFMHKIREVMEPHLSDSRFDVEQFAALMHITPVQLRRKLKALTNQTVTEYIRNQRLEKAAVLLRNKEGNVSEVAYQVGFESLPYFSKVFLERFGKSPSEWH